MTAGSILRTFVVFLAVAAVASCGGDNRRASTEQAGAEDYLARKDVGNPIEENKTDSSIWDIFKDDNSDVTVRVNKYIWAGALEVLDFLPIETIDPFSGVIVTGYGVPPGGGRAYRATVYVRDPSLDARALNVAMQRRGGGAVSASTVKAVEDAILTRARQLRIADGKL